MDFSEKILFARERKVNNMMLRNRRLNKRSIANRIALLMLVCTTAIVPFRLTYADEVEVKPYLALGADLKSGEKATVLKLLGVNEKELEDYEVVTVTNKDEHEYLDDYMDKSVIGSRALSSVKIEEADAGTGISVETKNISFCTEKMYSNALATAGVEDAKVTVVAPFKISGTAALVGAMKAYGSMTGDVIDEDDADSAVNELVLTGQIAEAIGPDAATNLVALVKDKVVNDDLSNEEDIKKAVDEAANELKVSLSDEDKQKIVDLMKKIADLDLNLDSLKNQVKNVYNDLKNMDIDLSEAKGFFSKIADFFSSMFDKIAKFFGE